jgi:hypothetical protein
LLSREEDFNEIVQLFTTVVNDTKLPILTRCQTACGYAVIMHSFMHPSVTAAYESAMLLIRDTLSYAPTIEAQRFRLAAMRDNYEKLPLFYASYQIHSGHFSKSVETLE